MTAERYVWQPTSAEIAKRFGLDLDQVVRFDQNTAPQATDWTIPLAEAPLHSLNEYPAASYRPLREAAAAYAGVAPTQVVPGAGVDELILLAARTFLAPGDRAAGFTPTYPLYRIATEQQRATFTSSPVSTAFASDGADLTWICVPNNPTGNRLPDSAIERIIETAPGVVVLDAAYAEFTGDLWGAWVARYSHLLVLHTLSKGFGLAGIRVGYAIGNESLIDAIDRVRPPGSISTLSSALAIAALSDPERMRRAVADLIVERGRFRDHLMNIGLDVARSEANFLLAYIGPTAPVVAAALMSEGLVVRGFSHIPELGDYLRFTVRSPSDNTRLIDTIERIRS